MTGEAWFVLITVGVHLLGGGLLIWAIAGREVLELFRTDDGDDGRGEGEPPAPPEPDHPRGGLPLPDADPSAVRLREPGRIGDRYGRPPRRRHVDAPPAPEREPATP